MNELKAKISIYLLISIAIERLCVCIQSDFLFEYLSENILTILLALLAVNTATLGLLATKIQDVILKTTALDFSKVFKEMKLSLLEQIFLICLSVIILVLDDSPFFNGVCIQSVIHFLMIGVLIYAIDILWDTGKSIFVILELIQEFTKRNQ